ncbi:MAG: hypothetical protein ACRDE8_06780 [Ginsengibacter sp.]
MPVKYLIAGLNFLFVIISASVANDPVQWIKKDCKFYNINYTSHDENLINEYQEMIFNGVKKVEVFFGNPYRKKFEVFIYPDRNALDSAWAKNWNSPALNQNVGW